MAQLKAQVFGRARTDTTLDIAIRSDHPWRGFESATGPEQLASRSLYNVCDAFPKSALRILAPKPKPVHEHVSEKSGRDSPLVVTRGDLKNRKLKIRVPPGIYQGGPEKGHYTSERSGTTSISKPELILHLI